MTKFNAVKVARRVIDIEAQGLAALANGLGAEFADVVAAIKAISGHTVLTGVGKSGHVARKIAATLASTGTTALYIHPTEASHGDMGMITKADCVIALSRSGETTELADIIQYCKRAAIPLIAMTCNKNSALGKAGDYLLHLPDTPEACSVTGAPTTSTTLQMALGDALAVALLESRGFTPEDFKVFHPGGSLGAPLQS
ncbi:MAG: SIS domain-containing protein, partial [Robiginitomaculum sp.]|nr:SIS domain-containing protein [Robiginitomaculum sp.]